MLALVTLCVILIGVGFVVLQMDSTKTYIASKVEEAFAERFEGVLAIHSLKGAPPFDFNAIDVRIYPDSSSTEAVLAIDSLHFGIDVYELLRRRVVITNLELFQPEVYIGEGLESPGIKDAFIPEKSVQLIGEQEVDSVNSEPLEVGLLAPLVRIVDGRINIGHIPIQDSLLNIPDEWVVEELNAELYANYNSVERFLDIEEMGFVIPGLFNDKVEIFGQVFNDTEYFEFNAFSVKTGDSELQFGTKARGVDITIGSILEQLEQARYDIDISNIKLDTEHILDIYPTLNVPEQIAFGSLRSSGYLDSLDIDQIRIGTENTILAANGYVTDVLNMDESGFRFNLEQAHFDEKELEWILPSLTDVQKQAISDLQFSGFISREPSQYVTELTATGNRGNLSIDGFYDTSLDTTYRINVTSDSLNIAGLFNGINDSTSITGILEVEGTQIDPLDAIGTSNLIVSRSYIQGVEIDTLKLDASFNQGVITPELYAKVNEAIIDSRGEVMFSDQENSIQLTGSMDNINVQRFIGNEDINQTYTQLNYDISAAGNTLNDAYGQLTIDIPQSIINGDTLALHQLYVDLNAPDNEQRELRLTSTPLDLNVTGDINAESIHTLFTHWQQYFRERAASEILFTDQIEAKEDSLFLFPLNLDFNAQVKDVALLQTYMTDIPDIKTSASILGNVTVDSKNLLFNANVSDVSNRFGQLQSDSLVAQLTGNFRYNSKIKDFSGIELTANAHSITVADVVTEDVRLIANLTNDSLIVEQRIGKLGENASLNMSVTTLLQDSSISAYLNEFILGNETYKWVNEGVAQVTYDNNEKLFFDALKLTNEEQSIELDGVISKELQDSMLYNIQNLDLKDASDLINGRITFSGLVNGEFSTRALTRTPTIQGDLNIEELAIQNRIVGDIDVNSELNQEFNRFDTRITILTDSLKYPDYFIRNSRSGQDIVIDGYVYAPTAEGVAERDTLYYFDLDFKEIDMWFLPFVAPNVFEEMEGTVTGNGFFYGNLDTYDYQVDYVIEDAIYLKPVFLETFYYLTGNLSFSPEQGLEFNDMFVTDPTGGTGEVNGYYDFNDFSQRNDMFIRVVMDEMQFLKSSFSTAEPFFGDAFGTGTVVIRGTNVNPVIETEGVVQITEGSEIGIPLLEETVVEEDRKFIRMVSSFETTEESDSTANSQTTTTPEENRPRQTFNERFTLDLQFEASDPLAVRLIFDNVTGEVITTSGQGRLRITLEDQELSMFGNYDILSGDYNFVSGDIFSRRFSLDPGGSISWEGPADNAGLDLSAVFRSRPDVRALSCVENFDPNDANAAQRRQVELVLDVGGTISAIQNDFTFRLPNSIDNIQDNTLQTQLASLNTTQDEKLLQATSLLLTGRFLSICSSNQSNTDIAQNLNSTVVLNPILSNQVLSPFLSNQVNALLKSDVSSLDIDFNINEFNEVDLGVALRLYNDRLVFRRDGQVTGQQSNIGDIGATYRINQTISVTAFHRRDPSFGNSSNSNTQQVQDINGVGIEAQVEFDKGTELFEKIGRFFSRLFGRKRTDKGKNEQVTELRNNNDQ